MVLQSNNNYNRAFFSCITLRQWAILFSILIFIITAVVTICTVLGTLHTKNLLELLEDDIEEERNKSHMHKTYQGISPNEEKLQNSQNILFTMTNILTICMWLGWLNLVFAAFLFYGVTTGITIYIIPWVLLSGTTYLLAITTVIMGYFKLIPGIYISQMILWICFSASLIFIEMWYTIFLYYLSLNRARCLRYSSPTIVPAYGGYTHTIQPTLVISKKPMMV